MRLHLTLLACLLTASVANADALPTYERDLKPLFAKRCTVCHSTKRIDNAEVSGGLALDNYEAVLKGTSQQKIVISKNHAASSLFTRLTDPNEDVRMPRDDEPLSAREIRLIQDWIDGGMPKGTGVGEQPKAIAKRRNKRSLDLVVPFDRPAQKKGAAPVHSELRLRVAPVPSITALAFNADGSTLAVGSYGRIVLWDLKQGKPASFIDGFPGEVAALVFDPKAKALFVAGGLPGRSGVIRAYDLARPASFREFTGHDDVVTAVALRPDGGQLCSSSFDQTVRFWDTKKPEVSRVFKGHSDFVYDVAYLPDGKTVLSASKDRSIKQLNADTAKELKSFSDHNQDVFAIAIRPDGKEFVSTGEEPQLRVWTIDGDKPTKRVSAHGGPVHQLAISKNGGLLISASADGSARLFQTKTWNADRPLTGLKEWQYAAAIDDAGRLIASGGWDGLTRVWELKEKNPPVLKFILAQPTVSSSEPDWLSVGSDGKVESSAELQALIRRFEGGKEISPSGNGAIK